MNTVLKHPYVAVSGGRGESYGGNQMLLPDKTGRAVGCGVVAGLDLLLYLTRCRGVAVRDFPAGEGALPLAEYNRLAGELRRRYLPLIPGQGINGLVLALGLNLWFRRHRLPYTARWGVPYRRLWSEMERMLAADIPVILAVGPNFPKLWQHHALRLYDGAAEREPVDSGATAHAHYLTVTGMDDTWLRVSTWGRMCRIRREEYLAYVAAHSARLLSNILVIQSR